MAAAYCRGDCPGRREHAGGAGDLRKLEGDRVASSRYDVSYDMENLFVSPRVGCDILDGRCKWLFGDWFRSRPRI